MCFEGTAANTNLWKRAYFLFELMTNKDMMWLARRHHVLEIMLEGVATSAMPPSMGPGTVIFK